MYLEDDDIINIDSKNIEYKLYVGNMLEEDNELCFFSTKFRKVIEKMQQVIGIRIFLPDVGLGKLYTLDQNCRNLLLIFFFSYFGFSLYSYFRPEPKLA